jgi:hypothetical protein
MDDDSGRPEEMLVDSEGVIHTTAVGPPEGVLPPQALKAVATAIPDTLDEAVDSFEVIAHVALLWRDVLYDSLDLDASAVVRRIRQLANEENEIAPEDLEAALSLVTDLASSCLGRNAAVPLVEEVTNLWELAERWESFAHDAEALFGHMVLGHGVSLTPNFDEGTVFLEHLELHRSEGEAS